MASKVNYNDERFQDVEADKKTAIDENDELYGGMIANTDKYYDDLIENTQDWETTQTQLQNERNDFAIEQINQQKEQAQKDYIKEQSAAYGDWQKQSNAYGVEAEKMAAQGLQKTGYSETSQVSMYTAYQNRVAVAREALSRTMMNFDNSITEARLQNSSILAEIAAESQKQQLQLALEGFQYKNQLLLDQAAKKTELENIYHARWQDVLAQINQENALAEEIRQANLADARAKAQLKEEQRQFDAQLAYQKEQDSKQALIAKGGSSGVSNKGVPSASQLIKQVESGQSSNKSSELKVMNSPLTAEGAAKKVASGELIVTKQVGNQIWVAANPNYVKGQSTLDKYTWLK